MNAHNDVKRPSDQSLDARLVLAAVQLRFAAQVDIDTQLLRIAAVKSMLRVDDRTHTTLLLGFGNDMSSDSSLTR